MLDLKPGFLFGTSLDGPQVGPTATHGMHGYFPDEPDMAASFFLPGPHIPHGLTLGRIDMRDIAPTLAALLGVSLQSAEGHALTLHR